MFTSCCGYMFLNNTWVEEVWSFCFCFPYISWHSLLPNSYEKKGSHLSDFNKPVFLALNTVLPYVSINEKLYKCIFEVISKKLKDLSSGNKCYLLFIKFPFVSVSLFGKYIMNFLYWYIKGIIVKNDSKGSSFFRIITHKFVIFLNCDVWLSFCGCLCKLWCL